MKHPLFNLVVALSLVLCVAAIGLMRLTPFRSDTVGWPDGTMSAHRLGTDGD
jgi:hypothetical protein